jgi:hypothetical protein
MLRHSTSLPARTPEAAGRERIQRRVHTARLRALTVRRALISEYDITERIRSAAIAHMIAAA